MPYLKFYQVEDEKFAEERKIILTDKESIMIANKLARHFKFYIEEVTIRGNQQCGRAFMTQSRIKVPHNCNLDLLVHELAHIDRYLQTNFSSSKHDKKLMRTIAKFLKYCKKKNYWRKANIYQVQQLNAGSR